MPLELRLVLLLLLGLAVGAFVNWGVYALAWDPRPISPWSAKHPSAASRHWSDYLPLLGWLGLRRESALHGNVWVRPLLLELCCGIGLAALYWWETEGMLVPPWARPALAPQAAHAQFFSHAVLIAFMLIATFIDFDEQTIPDSVTVPGTLLGLLLAVLLPSSHLPEARGGPPPQVVNLLLTSPNDWIPELGGWRYLAVGCLIIGVWCFSLLPATATLRKGPLKGLAFYAASIRRDQLWPRYAILAALLMAGTAFVWIIGGAPWQSLLTSLVGLAFGGGLVWTVRVVGRVSLQREAMGFGDVTLMAMIGAFLGWQAALMVFFLSPVAALAIAVAQYLVTGRKDIAFGPYLCLAALFVIVAWDQVWNGFAAGVFVLGWIIPALVGACLMLMMGMLMFWRFFEELLFKPPDEKAKDAAGKELTNPKR